MIEPERGGWLIFAVLRRVTVFLLGTFVVVSALIDPESENTVAMLVIGMIMVGVLPLDTLFSWHLESRVRQPPPGPVPPAEPLSPAAGGTPTKGSPRT